MFLRSVRIDYLIENRTEYYFLSEFFRFAGFWVVPYICGETEIRAKCESIIYVSGIKDASAINYQEIKVRTKNPIEQLMAVLKIMGYESEEWYCLARIYVAHSLTLYSKNVDYALSVEWLKNAADVFCAVHNELAEVQGMYADYAKKYCQAKANVALFKIDGSTCYPLAEMKSDLEKLTKTYPDYINMQILSNLLYYSNIDVPEGAVNLCKFEIMEETSICLPELRYWIGNVFDAMEDDPFAEFYYTMSVDEKPDEETFRTLINFLLQRDDYDEAVGYLEQMIAFLDKRIRHKAATPNELDCYFWAHLKLAEVYYSDIKDYWMAIQYGEYIRVCYQELVDSSRFYDDFYGSSAEYARDHTVLSFNIAKVQSILESSYAELGLQNGVG